jgi:hypothetical protein
MVLPTIVEAGREMRENKFLVCGSQWLREQCWICFWLTADW